MSRIDCQQLAAPIASFNPRKSDLMKLQVHTPGPLKHEPEARQAMKRRATAVAGAPPAIARTYSASSWLTRSLVCDSSKRSHRRFPQRLD